MMLDYLAVENEEHIDPIRGGLEISVCQGIPWWYDDETFRCLHFLRFLFLAHEQSMHGSVQHLPAFQEVELEQKEVAD